MRHSPLPFNLRHFSKYFLLAAIPLLLYSCSKSGGSDNNNNNGGAKQAFSVDVSGSYPGSNAFEIRLQKNGQILALGAGWFVRLKADGVSVDGTFTPPAELITASSKFQISSIFPQDDGKILVFGTFVLSNGRKAIVRLNNDGSLDNSFNNPALDINYYRQSIGINEVRPLANGKLIIAGAFSYKVGNNFYNGIARLNADQSIDAGFLSPISGDDPFGVTNMQSFPDGTFLLLGYGAIKLKDGNNYNLVKISADGVWDNSYFLSGNYGGYSSAVALQGSKVLMGVGYVPTGGGLIRLNADGSKDNSFTPPSIGIEAINSILVRSDNSLILGRNASFQFQETTTFLTYVDSKGVTDTAFRLTDYTPGGVKSMVSIDDNTFLAAGSFTHDGKSYAILKLKKN